jgi:hypothetical protein
MNTGAAAKLGVKFGYATQSNRLTKRGAAKLPYIVFMIRLIHPPSKRT